MDAIVQHLISVENGRQHALELCIALRLNGALMSQPYNKGFLPNRDSYELNHNILKVLGAAESERSGLFTMPCKQQVDLAALKRRLRQNAEERGCHESPIGVPNYAQSADCLCERRATLDLVHHLQIGAYGQIRSKIYLTLRCFVPEELCEMICEYAMAAEEIPTDPRVIALDPKNFHYMMFMRRCAFQHRFQDEYRCPKYRSCNQNGEDRSRSIGP